MAKDGEELEKIVEIIERSISPAATIEQNVFLPVLSSNEGHTAQCDIVIRSGSRFRPTLTIVEVQDRNSKVDINTFRGWLGKVEDVGAQHLICVSRKEFPASIKERVSKSGANIFLVTIKDLSPDEIPLEFINFIFQYRNLEVKSINKFRPFVGQGEIYKLGLQPINHSLNDKVWSLDGCNLISLLGIFRSKTNIENIGAGDSGIFVGKSSLSFGLDDDEEVYYLHDGKLIRVGFDCEYDWEFECAEIPMSVASYEQNSDGSLAWVFEVNHESKSGVISVKLPVTQLANGHFELLDSVVNTQFDYSLDIVPSEKSAT